MPDGFILREALDMIGRTCRDEFGNPKAIDDSVYRTLCANLDGHGDPTPSIYRIAALHLLQQANNTRSIYTEEMLEASPRNIKRSFFNEFKLSLGIAGYFELLNSCYSEANETLVRLAPRDSRSGDYICILFGISVPVVLRRHQSDSTSLWELIGEAYVDERMEGEAFCSLEKDQVALQTVGFQVW